MISKILQFIKKLNLAISLAEFDSLFLIKNLKSFRLQYSLAEFFVKPSSLSISQKIHLFLQAQDNPILYILADEISVRSDSFFNPYSDFEVALSRQTIFKQSIKDEDVNFYIKLAQELIRVDFPSLAEHFKSLKSRLDLLLDMRLYASALEQFSPTLEIDWYATDKPQLCLLLPENSLHTTQLSPSQQAELIHQLAAKFYDDSQFVSSFYNFIIADDKVFIADFDALYFVDYNLKNYASCYLANAQSPKNLSQYKLRHLFLTLDYYCPNVSWRIIWAEHISNPTENISQNSDKFLPLLQQQGLNLAYSSTKNDFNPQSLAHLLDSSRHLHDPRFKKSSFLYFGPLLILIYLLYSCS